jgi:hypothetical protein
MQLKKWKKPGKFQRMAIRAGYPVDEAKRTWLRMNKGQSVARLPVRSSTWIGFAAGVCSFSTASRNGISNGVCALIEERLTWPLRAVPTGGGGLRPPPTGIYS